MGIMGCWTGWMEASASPRIELRSRSLLVLRTATAHRAVQVPTGNDDDAT